jgi:hypothetical protein
LIDPQDTSYAEIPGQKLQDGSPTFFLSLSIVCLFAFIGSICFMVVTRRRMSEEEKDDFVLLNLAVAYRQRRAQQIAARYQSENKPVPENIARLAGAQGQAQAQPAQLPGAPAGVETVQHQARIPMRFAKQKLLFTLLNLLCLIGLVVAFLASSSAPNINSQLSWPVVTLFAGMLVFGGLTVITKMRQLKYLHGARRPFEVDRSAGT